MPNRAMDLACKSALFTKRQMRKSRFGQSNSVLNSTKRRVFASGRICQICKKAAYKAKFGHKAQAVAPANLSAIFKFGGKIYEQANAVNLNK